MNKCLAIFLLFTIAACSFVEKIKDGETAYERKQYAIAVKMLTEEYENTALENLQGRKAFLIAECYHHMNQNKSAVQWYAKSYKHKYGNIALKKLAFGLKKDEQYERAFKSFNLLMQEEGNSIEYRREATACQQAADWKDQMDENEYKVDLTTFNSESAEYAPFVFGADQILFTSDRKSSTGDSKYHWTGNDYSDIFITTKGSSNASLFDQAINSEANEGTITFTKDRKTIFFSRCNSEGEEDAYCKILTATRKGNRWSDPIVLPFNQENVNYGHPTLSSNDSILFFSSNHPDGKGGYDIYYSALTEEGWKEPINLGAMINTIGDEKFPSIHNDTLYFSSDHHIGMGGLDIFKTFVDEQTGKWTPPFNLQAPINSGGDDFGLVIDEFAIKRGRTKQKGFFTSSRISGVGNDDIYSFEKMKKILTREEIAQKEKEKEKEDDRYEIYLVCKVVEPLFADPEDATSKRIGKKPVRDAKVNVQDASGTVDAQKTDSKGTFIMKIDFDSKYNFDASKVDYLAGKSSFSTYDVKKDPDNPVLTFNIEIEIEKIIYNKEITLDNIYYDLDKWDIRLDAKPALDELSQLLQDNPNINIQLASHTDCQGDPDYNQELSQKRAQSAVNYLISNGIESSRLMAKGYGENALAINCDCDDCTEDQHQSNRRTTFAIVK